MLNKITSRQQAIKRTSALFENQTDFLRKKQEGLKKSLSDTNDRNLLNSGSHILDSDFWGNKFFGFISRTLLQAGFRNKPITFICLSAFFGILLSSLSASLIPAYYLPFTTAAGVLLPYAYACKRISIRSKEFSSDYPVLLLATSSSIKAGLTPLLALERSTRLLPNSSILRQEVNTLMNKLKSGVAKEIAIGQFGANIYQPDLELFRSAFYLVLESGGRFAPTLERLATVSKDRSALIAGAQVSTANMRMTANILLAICPIILCMVAGRTENFWETITNHPLANQLASTGAMIIAGSYVLLRKMSNFKP